MPKPLEVMGVSRQQDTVKTGSLRRVNLEYLLAVCAICSGTWNLPCSKYDVRHKSAIVLGLGWKDGSVSVELSADSSNPSLLGEMMHR